jgi:uncharacterized protein YggE
MKVLIAAIAVLATALIAVGVLSVASAETTPAPAPAASSPVRTVSVEGVASEALAAEASAATATAAYRQGMADAISDGQAKAQFLAEKAGGTLGAPQSVSEGGGSIECSEGQEYLGAQPDFGNGSDVRVFAPESAAASPTPLAHKPAAKHHKKKHKAKAKAAVAGSCTLSTQVAIVYQLS